MFTSKKFTSNVAALAVAAASALIVSGCTTTMNDSGADTAMASDVPMVGGAAMFPTKTIVENAVNSKDHTTLVAAVKAAGLVDALSSPGPFTVFAPTNSAFAKLPAGTVETLVKPENKATLASILTYHVVPGKVGAGQLIEMIKQGGGKAELKTLNGGILTARVVGGKVILTDGKGGQATVTQADVFQSNGVIHVTDTVSLPG
ncbi:fasciclin domain-containing protein [uncultured Erythrobacter sp.]|uniref:fasciclin domain-containing protein n=1 Tax=uncultured Erythrobacter sp. TaxID=263913 RepID=UPI003747DDD9